MLTGQAEEKARKFCIDEYKDHIIYKTLARREKDIDRRGILEKLAEEGISTICSGESCWAANVKEKSVPFSYG